MLSKQKKNNLRQSVSAGGFALVRTFVKEILCCADESGVIAEVGTEDPQPILEARHDHFMHA